MIVSALIMITVTGAVFYLSLVVLQILSKAYDDYRERYVAKTMHDVGDVALFIEPRQILVLNLAASMVFGGLGYVAINPAIAVAGAVFGFFVPGALIKHYRKRRIKKFNQQLVTSLQSMSSAFKAGLTFQQAIEHVGREAQPPMSQEFGLLVKEIKLGVPMEEALLNMSRRVGSEDLDLMVNATNISRQLGGNMAEMFETISDTIRERFRLEGRIGALTAQGKLQGWVVAAMPALLGVVFNYLRPDLVGPMMSHMFGWVLVGLICVMEALGIFLIRRIVNIDI